MHHTLLYRVQQGQAGLKQECLSLSQTQPECLLLSLPPHKLDPHASQVEVSFA